MGGTSTSREFATFCCVDCLYIFAGRIPALFEDLPTCPVCCEPSVIDRILRYSYLEDGCSE